MESDVFNVTGKVVFSQIEKFFEWESGEENDHY